MVVPSETGPCGCGEHSSGVGLERSTAELSIFPLQMHSGGNLEMSLRLAELRKESCGTGSPCPNDSHVKITFGWQLQLLRTELWAALPAGLLCTMGSPSVPPNHGLGWAGCLLLMLSPLLLLLRFLSCPQQGHVFGVGHSVPLRWLFGPFIAAVPPVLA